MLQRSCACPLTYSLAVTLQAGTWLCVPAIYNSHPTIHQERAAAIMAKSVGLPLDTGILLTVLELEEIVGIDPVTTNNWLRRGIIQRHSIGGRRLRSRLFSAEQVYKAAVINELVRLGLQPFAASEAVNELWRHWNATEVQQGRKLYALVSPREWKGWKVQLGWQRPSGGALYGLGRPNSPPSPIELPEQVSIIIPISNLFSIVSSKLGKLR